MPRARAVLLDIDGTLTDGVGGPALPGTADAVRRIAASLPVRYVTNTTSWARAALEKVLVREGFPLEPGWLVTPSVLAERVLTARGDVRGILLASADARPDLAWFVETVPAEARAVLLATEGHELRIADLEPAVHALLAGARLYTLQQNRVFKRAGRLVTDLGPVAAFLGYAANVSWENCGKPSPLLFDTIAAELGVAKSDLVMVGDDAEFDASGAIAAGCGAGLLVRTGKYREGDAERVTPRPTAVIAGVTELARWLGLD